MFDVDGFSEEMCIKINNLFLLFKVRILSKLMRNWIVEVSGIIY